MMWWSHGFSLSLCDSEAQAITTGPYWSDWRPGGLGGKNGSGNKSHEHCRDFQEGVEVRLEETKENVGESVQMMLEVGLKREGQVGQWLNAGQECLLWHP